MLRLLLLHTAMGRVGRYLWDLGGFLVADIQGLCFFFPPSPEEKRLNFRDILVADGRKASAPKRVILVHSHLRQISVDSQG